MAKPRQKIPLISVPTRVECEFSLDESKWKQLEDAYGCSLTKAVRNEVNEATTTFLQFSRAEKNAGLMTGAFRRVQKLRTGATGLLNVIDGHPPTDITRRYVDEHIDDAA